MNMPRVLQIYLTTGILATIAFISGFLVCRKVAREDDGSPGGSSSSHPSTAVKAFYVDSLRQTHLCFVEEFSLSPDGRSIAYVESKKLRVTTLKEVLQLQRDMEFPGRILARGVGHTPNVGHISWSPNGKEIAYSLTSIENALKPSSKIQCVNVFSRRVKPMCPGDYPSWSPDGTRLAFTRGYQLLIRDPRRQEDAVIVSEEGGLRNLQSPAWSPDGRQIAYNLRDMSSLYVVDIQTRKVSRLAALSLVRPRYSSKGDWILAEEDSFLVEWSPEHFEGVGGGRLYLVSSMGDRFLPLLLRASDETANGELGWTMGNERADNPMPAITWSETCYRDNQDSQVISFEVRRSELPLSSVREGGASMNSDICCTETCM